MKNLWMKTITCCLFVLMSCAVANAQDENQDKPEKLSWAKYSDKEFDKHRFGETIVISFMRDLCPGCKAKRDALWSNADLVKAVSKRKTVLFEGNAAVDKDLAASVKKKFKVADYPVVILISKGMADKPVILKGIPEPDKVLKAVREHFPFDSETLKPKN